MSLNLVITMMDRDRRESMEAIFKSVGLPMSLTMLGRGTATMEHLSLNGLKATEKAVLSTVADSDKTRQLMRAAKVKMFIDIPGNGIMMSVPVKSVGGGKTLAYLNNGEQQPARYTPELNGKYELIVIVANEGRTDQVMNAARAAGATGGTVLHGKGTGSQNPKKFYNVSIASEKEVILMVAQNDRKAAIMQSVLHHAGPDSEAGAILFSLPVSEVAGFGLMEDSIT